ncbi:MAG: hypothetical protein GF329_17945 [Candidatus Lokiarchaeota archaeon]|nr:hypothetical protein [Candidatus Lokiarchaeota archaeon]
MIFIVFYSILGVFQLKLPLSNNNPAINSDININPNKFSNATIVSDNYSLWNTGDNRYPEITVDNLGYVHAVWEERTDGWWGIGESEIFYSVYRPLIGWSDPTCISDNRNNWSTNYCNSPSIAVYNGTVYVAYQELTDGWWGIDSEIVVVNYTASNGWSNISVVSDDYTLWNNLSSEEPRIAIDSRGIVHVVWYDGTDVPPYGTDTEIMYANYTPATQTWSNATVISDDFTNWNTGASYDPDIAIGTDDAIHVVWHDHTDSPSEWGNDTEIMYTKYSQTTKKWSNVTAISAVGGWNDGYTEDAKIGIDKDNNVHVVWRDNSDGGYWGNDIEIFYSMFNGFNWSNATIISDDYTGWNENSEYDPDIAISPNGTVYAVFSTDQSTIEWGDDWEIVYTYKVPKASWSNLTIISDDATLWNNMSSDEPSSYFDNFGNFFVIWQDHTDGWWGSDREIMFSVNKGAASTPSSKAQLIELSIRIQLNI